jgi:hypothetical protein
MEEDEDEMLVGKTFATKSDEGGWITVSCSSVILAIFNAS